MDQRLRDLLRRFDAEASASLADELVREHARLGVHAPTRVLRRSSRWRPLTEFVATWFERPLEDGDGCSPDELATAESRLGHALPAALAEWFLLVGRRLEDVQDSPARLEDLAADDDGLLTVWHENQGVWRICVRTDTEEDDPVVEPDEDFPVSGRLVETLLSMVISETLLGASSRRGPLGALGLDVRGGRVFGADPGAMHALNLPLLAGPGNPFFHDHELRARGDATLVIRHNLADLEWMTATPEALARLTASIGADRLASW